MTRLSIPLFLFACAVTPALAAAPAKPVAKPARSVPAKAAAAPTPATPATAAAKDPVITLVTQARDAQSKGDNELALRLAQSAIVADPARPVSYVALGDLYAAQGQGEYARSYYELALVIDPVEPAALKAIAALDGQARAASNTP